jgi:hypothetical protein
VGYEWLAARSRGPPRDAPPPDRAPSAADPYHPRYVNQHPSVPVGRLARSLSIALVVAACGGSGLGSNEWGWCKQHLPAVDVAAEGLQIPTAETAYQEPSWWPDYLTSSAQFNNTLLAASTAFTAACNSAADARGVGQARLQWCMTDGLADVWDASISLGGMVDITATTYAYKALPISKRIDNADFVRACNAAFAARPS